jgi:hypothetical protein
MRKLAIAMMLAVVPACGDDAAPSADTADVAAEVEDLEGRSVYRMTVVTSQETLELDRDLTDQSQYFAFGSTHIAPAVSLAMTDSVTFPRTMTINLNFGIVVGSEQYPIQTTGVGTYTFGELPPAINVFVRGLQYRSSLPGATGSVVVDTWNLETGAPVAGTFSGTLVAKDNPTSTIDVSGMFHFTLPARQ